jgi:valyl-tRNA synthetase
MNPPLPDNKPSDNQNVINQIDNFIAGLDMPADTTVATAVVTRNSTTVKEELNIPVPKTDQEIQEFILKNSAQLATLSIKSVQELQKVTVATGDPEQMAGLASLITAGAGAIETINKIHIQNKKAEVAKDVKKLEIEGKKEIQKLKNDGYLNLPQNGTNILIATREEIIKELTGKAKNKASDPSLTGDSIDVQAQVLPQPVQEQVLSAASL